MPGLLKGRHASFVSLGTLGLFTALAVVACSSGGASTASNEQTAGADGEGEPGEGMAGAGSEVTEEVPSRCGDGVVDESAGEQCEDGNDESGDGCSLCHYDCETDESCDDGEACNGEETCDAAEHRCQPGSAAEDQTECQMADDAAGACRAGACVPPGCGNGTPDDGEDCDDANADDADGCTSACKFTCTGDRDCDNGNVCDGVEVCDLENNTCKPGEAVECAAKGCTGECDPDIGGCVFPDVDEDGASCDADCDDGDGDRHPGAFECQDQKDNDCNPDTGDKESPSCECYLDGDGDGYSNTLSSTIVTNEDCPAKYTRTRPLDEATTDCGPKAAAAFPGQTEFFPTPYCPGILACKVGEGSYDYNCDGDETSSLSDNKVAAATCAGGLSGIVFCQSRSGWVTKVPECGAEGTFRSCNWVNDACVGTDTPNRARPCR